MSLQMPIRLIATDMDGTLLTDEPLILPETADVLRRAAEKGMRATVNADAHCAEALCFGFAPAREMLRQAGFSSVWVLRGGAFCEEAL